MTNRLESELAHRYIYAALKTGFMPPIISVWLLDNFSLVILNDIISYELEYINEQ